jgi:hypothetical protein
MRIFCYSFLFVADLGNDMEFIDENEIVLRMLDDMMMTYKYGYVPKCTRSHICKLNKAAASGGQPQSTIVPLMRSAQVSLQSLLDYQ